MLERRGILALAAAAGIGAGTAGFAKRLVDMIPFTSRGRKALHPIYGNANTPEWLRDAKTGALRPNPQWTLRHTVDLQCHSECGLRVKIDRATGRVQRIIGNPVSPEHAQRLRAGQHADDRHRAPARHGLRPRQRRHPERLRPLSGAGAAEAQGRARQRPVAADLLGAADRRGHRRRQDLRRHR